MHVPIPSTPAIRFWACKGDWKRSTHPIQYTSGAWVLWLSQGRRHSLGDCPFTLYVPTKNLSPKRISQSVGRTMETTGENISCWFQPLWVEFYDIKNTTSNLDQWLQSAVTLVAFVITSNNTGLLWTFLLRFNSHWRAIIHKLILYPVHATQVKIMKSTLVITFRRKATAVLTTVDYFYP